MPAWAREVERRLLTGQPKATDVYWADPARILSDSGIQPDRWQADLLRSNAERFLLLCSRQVGKSLTAAGLALREALLVPDSLVLLLSPTLRQSGELFRDKVLRLYADLGQPLLGRPPTQLTLELSNGSRIISLPDSEAGVRCYSSVRLLVIDEAARVSDALYLAVRPMLAVSGGRIIGMSTAYAKTGWFYRAWTSTSTWLRICVTADQCPRLTPEFLAEERREMGERFYLQEYHCVFGEMLDSVFREEDIAAAMVDDLVPIFGT
jgi:hypothetical protein